MKLTMREVLEIVRDCSAQEWQQPDGRRMGATDNQGRRLWFISEAVMQEVRSALASSGMKEGKCGRSVTSAQQPHKPILHALPDPLSDT